MIGQSQLGAAQVFISTAGLFVQADFLDGGRQLTADCYQKILVIAAVLARFAAADTHDPNRLVLAPEQYPYPGG